MRITLDYRHPTPGHCDVAVFLDGALTGTLRLRQTEVVGFQQILAHGCAKGIDTFRATGSPHPPGLPEDWVPVAQQEPLTQLDAVATTGGKATIATTQEVRRP